MPEVDRQQKALSAADVFRAEFAHDLDGLRRLAGLTYRELSRRTGCARSTLHDALTGRRFPRLETVLAIVRSCGGDTGRWRARWVTAGRGSPATPAEHSLAELLDRLEIPRDQIARAVARWRLIAQVAQPGTAPTMSRQSTRPS